MTVNARASIAGDSTFAMSLEAQARGYKLFHYTPDRLSMRDGKVYATVEPMVLRDIKGDHFERSQSEHWDLVEAAVRVDPFQVRVEGQALAYVAFHQDPLHRPLFRRLRLAKPLGESGRIAACPLDQVGQSVAAETAQSRPQLNPSGPA